MPETILRLALPAPVWGLFDYLPPRNVDAQALRPGHRLMVPFGRGRRCGLLVEVAGGSGVPRGRLKRVEKLLDEKPLLDATHLEFLRWAAGYYHHPPGEVLMSALPVRLRKGRPLLRQAPNRVCLSEEGAGQLLEGLSRAPRQQELVRWLLDAGGCSGLEALRARFPTAPAILRALREKGIVTLVHEWEPPPTGKPLQPGYALNEEQQAVVESVSAELGRYGAWLLEGVTGSGKTEVYLQLAQRAIAQGRNVLLLVPEISLTPQLVARFRERLQVPTALLHSARSEGEREQDWQLAASGRARLVIGTRSAVLAPMPELGLVLVDEEHDPSYKQQEGFRYSARDLALVRAHRAGCPVLLGSATPSLETLKNAAEGRYRWMKLRRRAGGAVPPAMHLVDVRNQRLEGGLSAPLLAMLEETLSGGQQAMIFLNRRGYAPVLTCYACGWLSDCPRCDARQTYHRRWHKLICHHCGSERPVPKACPACGAEELHPLGQGTEQLEQVLEQRFPRYPLVRIDRDTTSRKGSLQRLLEEVRQGRAGLLVGTQMLAKGHHFPGVSLVAMVDVDGGLFGADFRAAERMAQLIVQVAGRAGRGEHPGRVLLQTRFPDHPLLQTLVREGYPAFAAQALAERKAAELPPYSHQALLRASATRLETAEEFLQQAAEVAATLAGSHIAVWGPVPAPMPRRAGKFRAQLLLQAAERKPLQQLLDGLVPRLQKLPDATRVRWSLDVDPADLY
ncbi:MAG: primosomal protein N' [Gammaproteobacteria bacterium]|nr:MAG: primosomal protein N' [Gammaproteobacteria bacterium]